MPGGQGYVGGAPGYYQTGAPYGSYYGLPTSSMATISMILGILGVVFFCVWFLGLVFSLLGITFGIISFNECGGVAPRAYGKGMATAGIICGGISILMFVTLVLMAGWSFSPWFGGAF